MFESCIFRYEELNKEKLLQIIICSLFKEVHSSAVTNCMILPVFLSHKEVPEKEVKIYTLLDKANDTTFIKTSVIQCLGIEGTKTILQLNTKLGRDEIDINRIEGLIVTTLDEQVEK